MEDEPNNVIAFDQIELIGKQVEPEFETSNRVINRNLQLSNLSRKDLYVMQLREELATNIEQIPICKGGAVFFDEAKRNRLMKEHYLVACSSKAGFLRKMLRTNIQQSSIRQENDNIGGVSKFFAKKKKGD